MTVSVHELNIWKNKLKKGRKYMFLKLDHMQNKTVCGEAFTTKDYHSHIPKKEEGYRYEIQRVKYINTRNEKNNHIRIIKPPKLKFR